jgi:hypothetical protein
MIMILGVGLIHYGELVPNNSYILFGNINESLGALLCVTDKVDCCGGDGLDSLSPSAAQWYYPNGNLVSGMGVVYQERSIAMVRLLRRDGLSPFGLYHCIITNKRNVNHNLYVGIYSATEGTHINYYVVKLFMRYISGNLSISQDIEFQLVSSNSSLPVFMLRCISNGGPVGRIMWMRNGTSLSSEVSGVIKHPSVIVDATRAIYEHQLTVTGRMLGYYRCNVTNNKPSIAYRDIGIFSESLNISLFPHI